ncbi:YciI family protein [Caulobacter sp. BK020]|uniref:YciI family protein n=1 Tax=Caulobacter sp. BK020 TaxID=2512117 RepID=UPI00104EC2E7|nr:YciI family protein [Caulobacter sp. BK020]TCS03904.1 hypothetical protein EV278_13224 [Caulobacter sp. BK020]
MKYILMMQFALSKWKTDMIHNWPAHDIEVHMEHLRRFREEFTASGEMVVTHGLLPPEHARFVRASQGGAPEVTNGPFPETKEFLAGYVIVDVETPERAYHIASRWSEGPGPGGKPLNLPVEVRPVMSPNGEEM